MNTAAANTRARIAVVSQGKLYFRTPEKNRDRVMDLLDRALAHRPDLVCLPETFPTVSVTAENAAELAEPLTGPTAQAAAERARRHHCYVVCPLLTCRDDGKIYNSAIVFGRDGEIVGTYDKRRPVTSSADYTVFENGVTPGAGDGVFDLDFGRIGIRICFDVGFPEDWDSLARAGARLVLWPSAYNGGFPLRAHAARCRFYVATAVETERSRIIDPCGAVLAETDQYLNIVVRDINMDYAVCHYDFNGGIPKRILADYAGRVEIRSYGDDGLFVIEPTDPTVTIAALREQYGFETADEYHQRHREAYAALSRGEAPLPQQAPHGDRPPYGGN